MIGGNGALGKAVVRRFKQDGWKIHSMDINTNSRADKNFLVDPNVKMQNQAESLIKSASSQYDSIICVAGGFDMGSIKDNNIFD